MKTENWVVVIDKENSCVCVGFRYYRQSGIYKYKGRKDQRTIIKKLKTMLRYDVSKKAGI